MFLLLSRKKYNELLARLDAEEKKNADNSASHARQMRAIAAERDDYRAKFEQGLRSKAVQDRIEEAYRRGEYEAGVKLRAALMDPMYRP